MTTNAPPIPCDRCSAMFWALSGQTRCRACRFAYTPPTPRLSIAARIARTDAERAGKPTRLAAIRAAQTAKQRRAMGLPA